MSGQDAGLYAMTPTKRSSVPYVDSKEVSRLAYGSIEGRLEMVRLAFKLYALQNAGTKHAEPFAIHDDHVFAHLDDKVYRFNYAWKNGKPEFISHQEEPVKMVGENEVPRWARETAEEAVGLLLAGKSKEARNRLRDLSEAVVAGAAYTTSSLIQRLSGGFRKTWADVYAEKGREIRGAMHGEIGGIQESLPKARFRVLATEHSPENPERFRQSVLDGLDIVLARYEKIAEDLSALDTMGGSGSTYIQPDVDALLQNVQSFAASLRETAQQVTSSGRQILSLERDGDLSVLARVHDLLADGLEDAAVCATFVKMLLRSENLPGGTTP